MWILRAGKLGYEGLKWAFNRQITTGGIAATTAIGTGAWTIDNATGNVASESIMNSEVGGRALETYFKATSFLNNQQAKVIQNGLENFLDDNGKIDKDSAEYIGSDNKLLLTAATHFALGHDQDAFVALQNTKDVDIAADDLVEAFRTTQARHPEAQPQELALLIYGDIEEKINKQRADAQLAADHAQEDNINTQSVQTPQHDAIVDTLNTGKIASVPDIKTKASQGVDATAGSLKSSFAEATGIAAFFAPVMEVLESIKNAFNAVKEFVQDFLMPSEQTNKSYNDLLASNKNGMVQSSTNAFGQFNGTTPTPTQELAL